MTTLHGTKCTRDTKAGVKCTGTIKLISYDRGEPKEKNAHKRRTQLEYQCDRCRHRQAITRPI